MASSFIVDGSSIYPWIAKTPDAGLDYSLNWADWLGTDAISAVTWTVPTGLTKGTTSNTTTVATVWLSAGKAGATYQVKCAITTTGGRSDTRTFEIRVNPR